MKTMLLLLLVLSCGACQTFQQIEPSTLTQEEKSRILLRWMNKGSIEWKYQSFVHNINGVETIILN